jgi:hypothetical protein
MTELPVIRQVEAAQYHGSIYDIVPKTGFKKPTANGTVKITAKGRLITVVLNGTISSTQI